MNDMSFIKSSVPFVSWFVKGRNSEHLHVYPIHIRLIQFIIMRSGIKKCSFNIGEQHRSVLLPIHQVPRSMQFTFHTYNLQFSATDNLQCIKYVIIQMSWHYHHCVTLHWYDYDIKVIERNIFFSKFPLDVIPLKVSNRTFQYY